MSNIPLGLSWWLRWWRICLQCGKRGFDSWVGKIPWRRAGQPTWVFLPEESPRTKKPGGGGPQPMGSKRVRHNWMTKHSTAQHSIVYSMYHSFCIHSSVDGYLGCFHILAIVNSAAVNTAVHVSFSILVSSGCVPSSGISGSYGGFIPSFFKESPYCLP